jgi:hypothetical protein
MSTSSQSSATTIGGVDVRSYHHFWENVSDEVHKKYEGKFVALAPSDQGWQLIAAADKLDELQESLAASGIDSSDVVFDRVHVETLIAPGIELQ